MKIVKNKIAILLALVMIFEVVAPVASYALTSGPSQPEFNSFEPANSTQMVDLFTGDFTYNIPLLNVPGSNGGYPINLFYNSVTNVEQEASMVGLGWNIGVGSINRQMRGIPDDFSGESIRQFTDRKPSRTVGLNATIGGEVLAFDSAKNNFGLELSLRSSLSYSNYKGLGYSYGFQGTTRFHKRFGVSFGSNYSSHDGITSSTGLSLFKRGKDDKATNEEIGGLTLTSNSLSGIKTISLNPSEKFLDKFTGSSVSYSTSDRPTFVPSYELPYFGSNITLGLKTGLEIVFTEPYQTTYGSYRTQTLHNNRRWTSIPTYGYLYLENDKIDNNGNGSSLLDFNRIKDGAINEYHTNLAIPFATEDYFSLSGHGTGGVFKLQRNDIGYFRDRNVTSATGGGSAILEGGLGGTAKAGADIELNYSLDKVDINSTSLNQVVTNSDFDFKGNSIGRESKYFFLNSEMTAELNESENSNHKLFEDYSYIGKDDLLTFDVDNAGLFDRGELKGNLKDESKNIVDLQNGVRSHRKPRGTNIQYFTNNELLGKIGPPLANGGGNINTYDIPQFKIPGVQRLANDQIGAFVVTDKSGVRWNYGLPVINKDHKELTFSVEQEEDQCKSSIEIDYFTNSDRDDIKSINNKIDNLPGNSKCENLLEAKEIPSYAHSHLLTSILSDDYVDNDYLDGLPNDKDFGGWVKFTYLKASDYKWRVPFFGANYIPGLTGVSHDDKASFVYGEREQYYPQTIETNSHIAKFTYSNREDGRGASYVLQNTADILDKSAYSLKLDKIELFAKGGEEKLIKTVNFTFDENYSLCPQVHNNLNGGGKLTLKEVSFTNYESNRASLNPYKFSYFNESAEDAIQYKYDLYNYDRWGVFKEHSLSRCDNVYEPFTEQSGEDIKNIQRENARAWHLKSIVLPSGSSIELDIERDDYAYVQNHQAMKMFQIAGIGELAGSNVSHSDESNLNYNKIFFKLEDPTNEVNDLDKYLDGLYEEYRTVGAIEVEQPEYRKQVFFKINSDLLKDGNYEYVDFAAYIKDFGLCTDGSCMEDGKSAYGYIEIEDYYLDLKFGSLTNGNAMIHPFLLSSWQFIKSNLSTEFMQSDEFNIPFSVSGILELLREMANSFPIVNLFRKGFYTKCADEDFASTIDLSSSFIRLNVPNKIKYGGGVRVASVMMTNTWNNALEETPVYGTVYNYETVEENGEIISSGVAANEPIVGKQENAYYYMKRLRQDLKFNVDDFKFELHPYNDQSLPSSVVGYSKVSVSSLASNFKYLKHKGTADDGLYNNHFVDDPNLGTQAYESISTTGKTVHEFYTAKDFPVVTKESIINSSKYSPRFIPLLWVGSIKTDIMVSSQAYNAEINDMHGKPLKTTYISQNKDGSYLEDLPISSVEYKYHDFTEKYKFGDRILERKRLSNEVDILTDYLPKATQSTAQIYKGELGVSRMLNLDIRNNSHVDISGGMEFNLDVVGYPPFLLFVPSAIPEFTLYDSEFTSGVTNKVISKKGILKEVIVSDGLSKIQTENLAYDPYCGNAVLSRTTNEYEKDKDGNNSYVYDYKIPAYMGYDKLGPSYENANLKFSVPYPFTSSLPNLTIDIEGPVQTGEVTRSDIFLHVGPELDSKLKVGDDYILRLKGINSNSQIVSIAERISEGSWRVDPYGIELNNIIAEDPFALQDVTEFEFTLLRSGNRNNLTAPGQSIKALSNPTQYASVQEVGVNTYLNGGDSDGNEETVEGLLTKDITIDKVLDASVAEYSEKWETAGGAYTYDACASPPSSSSSSSSSSSFSTATVYYFDKFRKGGRGIYRLKSACRRARHL